MLSRQSYLKALPVQVYYGVHGAIITLGKMNRGIEISLSQSSSVEIARDRETATIGGGIMSKKVTDDLWTIGKQTVIGACECVSYRGPSLGGGYRWLQGRYGLIADQFISARIVLDDKVDAVYQPTNDHLLKNGTQPVDVINWSYWLNVRDIDPVNPVTSFYIIQGVTVVDP